jgi:hypothetical protein
LKRSALPHAPRTSPAQAWFQRDRNGKSDPYIQLRSGASRAESEVIKNCLNPAWGLATDFTADKASPNEFTVDFAVYRDTLLFHSVREFFLEDWT